VIELHSLSVRGVWRPKEDTLTATVVSNDYRCCRRRISRMWSQFVLVADTLIVTDEVIL
jgi:hypothetical protein